MKLTHLTNQESLSSINQKISDFDTEEPDQKNISFQSEVPEAIQLAMNSFIEKHPNWDQYRLVQAALAGFLVQNGVNSRSVTRLYIGNMFGSNYP